MLKDSHAQVLERLSAALPQEKPQRVAALAAPATLVVVLAALLFSMTAASARPALAAKRTFSPLDVVAAAMPDATSMALSDTTPKALPKPLPKPRPSVKAPATRRGATSSRGGSRGGWSSATVSWYGPGFYGKTMAGGGTLQRDSMVCAHRSLAFGTRVMFEYRGRTVTAVVRDRGPYVGGRTFDLGPGTAKALGFSGVGTVRYRILGR